MIRHIAILGATGHVGANLVAHLPEHDVHLTLVVRSAEKVRALLARVQRSAADTTVTGFDNLASLSADALVNCVGLGDPADVARAGESIYALTSHFDDVCADHLARRPDTVLVNFSSGAVYGTDFAQPAGDDTVLRVAPNAITAQDHYGIAKLASEGRHRAAGGSIIDLRLFGLFSRYIDPAARFLVNDLVRCVREDAEFVTGPADIVRDFVAPEDLAALVVAAAGADGTNAAYDVVSVAPVRKSELVEAFIEHFGLRVRVDDAFAAPAATGNKDHYHSTSRRAYELGWRPTATALEAVLSEAGHVLREGDHRP